MIIDRNTLLDALSKVVGITEWRSVMPVLKNVKVVFGEKSSVTATDLEVSAIVALPQADDDMELFINGRLMFDILRGLEKGDVEILRDGTIAYVKQGKTVYTLAVADAGDYPSVDTVLKDVSVEFTLESKVLLDAIRSVEYAVSDDETRYQISGVRLMSRNGKLTTIGTDGFRLAMKLQDIPLVFDGVTIPRKALSDIYNIAGMGEQVNVSVGKNAVKFVTAKSLLICRTIDAAYPELDAVVTVNGDHNDASIDRSEFLRAVKKVMIMAPKDRVIKAELSNNGTLTLEAQGDVGKAKEVVPLVYGGGDVVFCLNGRYLIDVLGNGTDDKISLKVPKPEHAVGRAIFFIENDASTLGIVMPVRT